MDPPSPIMRDISTEQILEDLINDGAVPESPSTFLNPSGEGVEVDESGDGEADGSGDGEADGSGDGEADGYGDGEAIGSDDGEAGEVYIYEVRRI